MSEWGVALGKSYLIEVNQALVAKLKGSGDDFSAYQSSVLKELEFLDSQGWDKKGKADYIKYLNVEYKHYKENNLGKNVLGFDYFALTGAWKLTIESLHAFLANLKYISSTFYLDHPFSNGDIVYNFYDEPNIRGYNDQATHAFAAQGSSIVKSYLYDDLVGDQVKRAVKAMLPQLVVGGLLIAAIQVIPYADVVIDTALIAQAGYHLVKDGELSNEDWINIATIGLARGVSKIKFSKVISKLSKVDDLGKLTAEARGVNTERLTQIVENIGADQTRLSESQLHSLVEASDINSSSDTTLLGGWTKDNSSYEQLANQHSYNYYDMGDAYNALNKKIPNSGEQVNDVWLQKKIEAGNEFVLSKNPAEALSGTSYYNELKMLQEKYVIPKSPSSDGLWHLMKK